MRSWLCVLAITIGTDAIAAPRRAPPVVVDVPAGPVAAAAPSTLVLNRCAAGCSVTTGSNDALANMSNIPTTAGTFAVSPFGFGDAEWAAVVACVREVYSPYAIDVVEARPAAGVAFNEIWIAGLPQQLGFGGDILGIAPLANDCRALANVLAFAFANNHPVTDRVNNLCWTVVQESAHTFGLDHEYVFTDGDSACSDPMTYRTDCGGQKFFRDREAQCGEDTARACQCKGTQNSHALLVQKLGAGTSTVPPPTVSIATPADHTTFQAGEAVDAKAFSQRGVERVRLLINGYPWLEVPGTAFGRSGQPEVVYPFVPPADVPDGNLTFEARAEDDLGGTATSAPIHVLKGAPCVDASTCLTGQKCTDGGCFWDPPTRELGQACDYPQMCTSGACEGGACVETCDPTSSRPQCEDGLVCDDATHRCRSLGGGCCSAADPSVRWVHAGLGMIVLSLALRRRRVVRSNACG